MRRTLRTITFDAQTVEQWGRFSADTNPLHTDAAFAASTPFGVPIVHGHLVASVALDVLQEALGAAPAAMHGAAVRFAAPVPVGATVDVVWDDVDETLTVREQGVAAGAEPGAAQRAAKVLVEVRPEQLSRATTTLSRAVVDEYARAAHDANSIHMSDDAARAEGFPGAIAHGMLTMGWAAQQLVEHIDVRALRSVRARFAAPVPVGDEIALFVDAADGAATALRVQADGTVVLTLDAQHGDGDGDGAREPLPELPDDAEVVADTLLSLTADDAIRFARAVGCGDGIFTSHERAQAAGFDAIPLVPTLVFAAAFIGHLPDEPSNAGKRAPDPVQDCQAWARTDKPVVHAGQELTFARPMLVDERIRARTAVMSRSERTSSRGQRLRFTVVRTTFSDTRGDVIALSEMNLVVIGD